jgi:hypothetical protein
MRSTFSKIARSGAALAFALSFSAVVTACDSCDSCASPCAPKCAPPPAPACAPACPEPACPPQSGCGAFPAEAKPGEAWCCVYIPPEYKTETYQVCCRPESCTEECVPAVMGTRPKQVCTSPCSQRCETIPAEYATQEECIEVCPARTEWQKVECPQGGEQREGCYALVTIPPTFEKRTKTICTKEASTRTIDIPAVYETVMETYEVSPAYTKKIPVPAEYKTESKQICVREGQWVWKKNETCAVPMPAMPNPANPCGANTGMTPTPAMPK